MSLETRSSFFYISPVDVNNYYLNFKEGAGPELTAQIEVGAYTHTDLSSVIASALNTAGALTYSVSLDRDLRKYTISASGAFTLLISTGSNVGGDIFSLIGFTGSDTSSATSHTGNLAAGSEYLPQFVLQSYVSAEDNKRAISPSVNKTASGAVEVVKFGSEKFFEFNIRMTTDIDQGQSQFIETDLNGVSNLRAFLNFCIEKNNLEFMPDRDDKATFYTVLLESTADSSNGTGFKLHELYDSGLPGYFESGLLIFRLVE